MRSLYTIALIVLINLASYGKVHAQGQNPVSNSGKPWCTGNTGTTQFPQVITIADPSENWPLAGCQQSPPAPSGQCVVDAGNTPPPKGTSDPFAGDTRYYPAGVIWLINKAREGDGLKKALNLPFNYNALSQDQKLIVLINLEREDRGIAPFPPFPMAGGLVVNIPLSWEAHNHAAFLAEFYQLAKGGATTHATTTP
jgi:hypothetical protein